MNTTQPKRGDRVVLLQARHWPSMAHRKLPVYGRVLRVNGGYIYVRPMWGHRDNVCECYENELRVANGPVKLPRWATQRARFRP